jgi:hypothetical protein
VSRNVGFHHSGHDDSRRKETNYLLFESFWMRASQARQREMFPELATMPGMLLTVTPYGRIDSPATFADIVSLCG